KASKFCL
ncbi:primosomal N' domain protein, partial [Chlamydia psittaci 84-8471/1]